MRLAPAATGFLRVTGLPAGTQVVTVKLVSGLVALRRADRSFTVGGVLTAASGTARAESGGRYV